MKKSVSILFVALLVSVLFATTVYTHRYQAVPTADRWYAQHTQGYSSHPPDRVEIYPIYDDHRTYQRIVHCRNYRYCEDDRWDRTHILFFRDYRYQDTYW